MTLFCDCASLVKFDRSNGAHIVQTIPADFNFCDEENFVATCSFAESSRQANSIHASTVASGHCYHWAFMWQNEQYAITLKSHHLYASLFLKFLHDAQISYEKLDPSVRLTKIWEYLCSWEFDGVNIAVKTPKKTYSVVGSDSAFITYADFDPTVWLPETIDVDKVWQTVLSGAGILVVGSTPEIVSNAVFSLLSMIAPLKYSDPFLAYSKLGDPRFADVINGSTFWKIVGTTNTLAAERCKQFKIIIKLTHTATHTRDDYRKELRSQTLRILHKFENVMNDLLDKDPYRDFLGRDIPVDKCNMLHLACKQVGSLKNLKDFASSNTFHEWQRVISVRDAFRDSFLSCSPEEAVVNRTVEDLQQMESILGYLKTKYSNDGHVMAVIKAHAHMIRKVLKSKM